MRHSNIALFIPHLGCPNQCSFCNQNTISGENRMPSLDEIEQTIQNAMQSFTNETDECEIAFFGGSFTAIDFDYMCALLQTAQKFVRKYHLKGIRVSTRPDAVDRAVIAALKRYGVTAVELGAQSMDDTVLRLNRRGHTAEQVVSASKLIRSAGIELGLQMMVGLYGSDSETDYCTALKLADLCPDTVRIYPTVILKGTLLDELYQSGLYRPVPLSEAVETTARIMKLFFDREISVIKVGLHASEQLKSEMSGGLYHPAFRELCESQIYLEEAIRQIGSKRDQMLCLQVNPHAVSKMVGQHRANLVQIKQRTGCTVRVKENSALTLYEVALLEE